LTDARILAASSCEQQSGQPHRPRITGARAAVELYNVDNQGAQLEGKLPAAEVPADKPEPPPDKAPPDKAPPADSGG